MTTTLPRRILAILGAVLLSLLALTATGRAGAATDTTKPTVTVPAISSFIVGEQTDDTIVGDGGQPWFADGGANRRFTWTMTDASGIYRVTRNPMYLGMLLVLVGWAVFLANGLAVIAIALFPAYITRFQIKPEERALTALFGEQYASYSSRVRRWI